jgi:hypothetical protein
MYYNVLCKLVIVFLIFIFLSKNMEYYSILSENKYGDVVFELKLPTENLANIFIHALYFIETKVIDNVTFYSFTISHTERENLSQRLGLLPIDNENLPEQNIFHYEFSGPRNIYSGDLKGINFVNNKHLLVKLPRAEDKISMDVRLGSGYLEHAKYLCVSRPGFIKKDGKFYVKFTNMGMFDTERIIMKALKNMAKVIDRPTTNDDNKFYKISITKDSKTFIQENLINI